MYETRNDLSESTRKPVVQLLNERLAEAIDLQFQTKQAHWNVTGPNFVGLHDLFDRIADAASDYVDLIAERAVALGGVAEGTVQIVSRRSKLPEYPLAIREWTAHVEAIRSALATFGTAARRAIDETTDLKDADTADFSRRSRAASTSCSGWSKHTFRNERVMAVISIPTLRPTHTLSTPSSRCAGARLPHPDNPGTRDHVFEMGKGGAPHAELHAAVQPDLPVTGQGLLMVSL